LDARVNPLRLHAGCLLLALLALSCHDEGSVTDPPPAWQFTGGIIFELTAGSDAGGICAIDPDEASPTTHQLVQDGGEPRVSPDGTKLLQYRLTGSSSDLFISNLDGTDALNVTGTGSGLWESDGDWSPDMKRVVCSALFYPNVKRSLRVLSLTVPGETRDLTDTALVHAAAMPRYSPDGTRLAYIVRDSPGAERWLAVCFADGSSPRRYHPSTLIYPVWSPDGLRVAFGGPSEDALHILDLRDGLTSALGEGAKASSATTCWFPDSRLVFKADSAGLLNVRIATFAPSLTVRTLVAGFRSVDAVVLSPQATRLAIIGRQQEESLSLYTLGVDGSGLIRTALVDSSPQALISAQGCVAWID
jgi:dipeptidyl aminopeptidase/acylaminoacyl peptidase